MKNKIVYITWDVNLLGDQELANREKRWLAEKAKSETIFENTMKILEKM
ncbi:hypothetical protein [[Mycoplasma] phocae]|nr:hypothetical protein [[Mycoplasma] phocae]